MKTIIQKDQFKINSQISDYQTAIIKANQLIQAFTDAGYLLTDEQTQEFCQRNFSDETLRAYALSVCSTNTPAQQEKETREIADELKGIILKTIPGWYIDFQSFANVKIKNLKAIEEQKVIKSIEENNTVYADGVRLEVFNQLENIATGINEVMPKIKNSVFNRRLDYRYLFKENEEGKVIPNLNFIDFSDL
ncbi:hypothetical protein ACK1KB_11250 [Chryseobacterium sp. TY3]